MYFDKMRAVTYLFCVTFLVQRNYLSKICIHKETCYWKQTLIAIITEFMYLQYIRSGLSNRKMWGAGWLANGTLAVFFTGIPKMASPSVLSVPLLNDLMALTHA